MDAYYRVKPEAREKYHGFRTFVEFPGRLLEHQRSVDTYYHWFVAGQDSSVVARIKLEDLIEVQL